MAYVWLFWDLGALLILAVSVYFAARSGFVSMLISFFSYIAAMIAANIVSTPAAVWLYDNAVGDMVKGVLTGSLRETLAKSGGASEFAANAPVWLRAFFTKVPAGSLESMDLTQNVARVIDLFVDTALRDTILWFLSGIVFLAAFSILVVIVKQIARLFTFVDRIPLVGTLNTVLGGVLGAVQAVIILLAIAIVAHIVVMLSGDTLSFASTAVFEQSFLMRFFYHMTAF